jgi:hypothetical protein
MRNPVLVGGAAPCAPRPVYFTREGSLYRLRVWSEREWAMIPPARRPRAEHVPGLGWVGGDLIAVMN